MVIALAATPIIERMTGIYENTSVLLLVVGGLLIVDTLTGLRVAYTKKTINVNVFWGKSLNKLMAYFAILIVGYFVFLLSQEAGQFAMKIEKAEYIVKYIYGIIIVRELWSVLENIDVLQPGLTGKIKGLLNYLKK